MEHPIIKIIGGISTAMKNEVRMETVLVEALEHGVDPKMIAAQFRKVLACRVQTIEVTDDFNAKLQERIDAMAKEFGMEEGTTPSMDDVKEVVVDETTKSYIINDISAWPKQGGSGGS